MKVLIAGGGTGGHLMPALAIARALVELDPQVEPVLVGAQRGVEAELLPVRPYRHHLLPLEPIYRKSWWQNLRWPVIGWRALGACNSVLDTERPRIAVGTGGYASGPILFQAMRRGIPVAVQEQNALPGLATRWLARRARQVHLGFPEAARHLKPGPDTAVHSYGNPITPPPSPRPDRFAARHALGIEGESPVVMVMGGSQGARSINQAIRALLAAGGLGDVNLLWSTGQFTWEHFRIFDTPPTRQVRAWWDPIGEAYAAADLVVARAGAMTTAELCAWGLPAILIPLPTAAADHQTRNAEALAAAGAVIHLPDSQLSAGVLRETLGDLLESDRLVEMGAASAARGKPEAAASIAAELLRLAS